jgi:putative ABC transport system ATP-binding protein
METALFVKDVFKSFPVGPRRLEVLRGISLSIGRGEFVAVQGASGSGKSTLLSLLAGLDRPTQGEIHWEGRRVDLLPEAVLARLRREKIGFVFQSFHLVPSLTVLENVCLPLAFQNGKFSFEKGDRLLRAVGLEPRAAFFPDQLSGGEKQRAAIARALVNDPAVVFADEPTGNLDSVNGRAVLDLLEEHTRRAGKTLVLVTHDPEIARRADRRILLQDGKVRGE